MQRDDLTNRVTNQVMNRGLMQSTRVARLTLLSLTGLLALSGCGGSETKVQDANPNSAAWQWNLPAFFPVPRVPDNNPMTFEKVELGRHLFYDRKLSGNGTQACASCHQPSKAFTDGRALAVGSTGEVHPRNSQSLINVVYSPTLTWANPSLLTLEKQMEVPLFADHPVELGLTDANLPQVIGRLQADPIYAPLFQQAFPRDAQPFQIQNIIAAIASFQRNLISANSKFDRMQRQEAQLSASEKRGMDLFFGEKAECFHCHGSFNFNNQVVHAGSRFVETTFHNTGLYNLDGKGAYPTDNRGVFELTERLSDMGKFRAPSLRNVELTAPYNHDGSVATLEDVVANYAAGGRLITEGALAGDGRTNPHLDDLIVKIDLSQAEQADIVAFLKALTDDTIATNPRFANPFATRASSTAGQPSTTRTP